MLAVAVTADRVCVIPSRRLDDGVERPPEF